MAQELNKDVVTLAEVLDREYACLLQGDLKELSEVLARKEELLEQIRQHPDEFAPIVSQALSDQASRNQQLLSSAASGLRSVLRRLTELRSISDGSGTYQANGVRHDKTSPSGGLSRRA